MLQDIDLLKEKMWIRPQRHKKKQKSIHKITSNYKASITAKSTREQSTEWEKTFTSYFSNNPEYVWACIGGRLIKQPLVMLQCHFLSWLFLAHTPGRAVDNGSRLGPLTPTWESHMGILLRGFSLAQPQPQQALTCVARTSVLEPSSAACHSVRERKAGSQVEVGLLRHYTKGCRRPKLQLQATAATSTQSFLQYVAQYICFCPWTFNLPTWLYFS